MHTIVIRNSAKAEVFALIFQHMKALTDHVNIMFESERFYIQSMDNAHVSIMEVVLPKTWFDEYVFSESMTIGLSSSMFYKILNSRGKQQEILIEFESSSSDQIAIHFTGDSKQDFDKHFQLPLMTIDYDVMEIPTIEYQAELELGSSHFASIISQLQIFGDTMTIQCGENNIGLCSESLDQGKMTVEIKIDDISGFAIEEDLQLDLSFSLQYIRNMCMYNKISDKIQLQMSENYPMKVSYVLGENAHLSFFLAPKISDD